MQSQNFAEYKAVRQELAHVRTCITTYVRYVVVGAAPALWFLAGRTSEPHSALGMSFAAILLSLMSMLILFLLSYKFTSHNRCAGYSKLLTHEHFVSRTSGRNVSTLLDRCIFYWEICVDRLRAADSDPDRFQALLNLSGELNLPDMPDLKEILGSIAKRDRLAWLKGWALIFSCSHEKSGSWKLPIYIARIFGAINLILIFFAAYFLFTGDAYRQSLPGFAVIVLLCGLLIVLWAVFVAKLYAQMLGSQTVEAFCCKFTPLRAQLLTEISPDLEYRLRGVSIRAATFAQQAPHQTRRFQVQTVLSSFKRSLKAKTMSARASLALSLHSRRVWRHRSISIPPGNLVLVLVFLVVLLSAKS